MNKIFERFASLPKERQTAYARASLAVAQLVALLWFSPAKGLPLDDAWIHQVVARTFATSGTLGYAPGEHGAAATSYLWAALLAVNFKWIHVDPAKWAFLLNGVMTFVAGQLLLRMLARKVPAGVASGTWFAASLGATLLACTSANILWFAHSGMEASLVVGWSVIAIWAATGARGSNVRALVAGIAAALLAWTRPEGAPLGVALAAYTLYRHRDVVRALAAGAPSVVAVAAYAAVNYAKTGHALPSTLAGRRWLWLEPISGVGFMGRAGEMLNEWGNRLSTYVFDMSLPVLLVFLGLAVWGGFRLLRERNDGAFLLVAWTAAHTAFYLVLLPTPGHGGRYQPLVPLLVPALAGIGAFFVATDLVRLVQARLPKAREVYALVAFVPCFVVSSVAAAELRSANSLAVEHIQTTEIGTGKFLATLPKDAVVASFDIGGMGWVAGRTILDAGGLSDPKTARLLERGRIWEYLRDRSVQYVVLPEGFERVLPVIDDFASRLHLRNNPAIRLEPIHEIETPRDRWLPSIKSTWNAAPRQVVYRITYTGMPAADDVPLRATSRSIRDPGALVRDQDRAIAEHMLGVLADWNVPVDVVTTPAQRERTSPKEGCAIQLGPWGVEASGCSAFADAAVLRSTLYEFAGRYLDVGDLGGALRAVPHAIARARRASDARFDPPLAPLLEPMPRGPRPDPGELLALGLGAFAVAVALRRKLLAAPVLAASLAVGCGADGGRASLVRAAVTGDVDDVSTLLASGTSPDVREQGGPTALQLAAHEGRAGSVLLLAQAGASLDARSGPRRRAALHEAVLGLSADTLKALLAAGADPNVADSFGETPLHLLARMDPNQSLVLASVLMDAGADPSKPDARGFTTAHVAAANDDVPLLELVVQRVPSLAESETPSHETPLDVARRYARDRAAEALWRRGARPSRADAWPPLHEAARVDAFGRVALLLAAGADTTRTIAGKTALDVAREFHSEHAEALLAAASVRVH